MLINKQNIGSYMVSPVGAKKEISGWFPSASFLGVDPAPSGAGESILKNCIMQKVFMNLKKLIFQRLCVLTEIIYDSQDNLVKINNGDWFISWDYLNSQPVTK